MRSILPLTLLLPLLLAFVHGPAPQQGQATLQTADSLQLEAYIRQVANDHVEVPTNASMDEIHTLLAEERMGIVDAQVAHSPDSLLKIFVVEVEGCGAYCNSMWYSWLHYNNGSTEQVLEAEFSTIERIHRLPDGNYLVISWSHGRPASVLTILCGNAEILPVINGSIALPSEPRGQVFGFCQENGVEMEEEPQISYQDEDRTISYLYGNNFLYSHSLDVDSIYRGQLFYQNGRFYLGEEQVTVNDRSGE